MRATISAMDDQEAAAGLSSTVLVAIVGGFVTVVAAFVGGMWRWLGHRGKSRNDAQVSLVSGFVSLLASIQSERDRLLDRIAKLESDSNKQWRRIAKLERALLKAGREVPDDE